MASSAPPPAAARVIAPLFVVQFLSWGAMFCLWVYAVPVIGAIVRMGSGGGAAERSVLLIVSGCFALYGVFAAGLAFGIVPVVRRFGAGTVHGTGLLVAAAGFVALGSAHNPGLLVPAFAAIAVGWACMANIPYALVGAAAPAGRGAHTLRLFGFSTVVPQIVVSLSLALGTSILFGDAVAPVMLVGAAMMAAGGGLTIALRRRFDLPLTEW